MEKLKPYNNLFIKNKDNKNVYLYHYNPKEEDKVGWIGQMIRKFIFPRWKIKSPIYLDNVTVSSLGKKNIFLYKKLKKAMENKGTYVILREKAYPCYLYISIDNVLVAKTETKIKI